MTAVLAVGLVNLAQGQHFSVNAAFAQHVMQRAWQRGDATASPGKRIAPLWSAADTFPVARLTSDALDDELFVLPGSSQYSLTLGPGHLQASVLPGEPGNSIIAGHSDTHFSFLADLTVGDHLVIDRRDGVRAMFIVSRFEVMDARTGSIALESDAPRLTLVADYPFDSDQHAGSLRYVVSARAF